MVQITKIEISKFIYDEWVSFYKKHDSVEYTSIKNFTEKKMLQIMEIHNNHNAIALELKQKAKAKELNQYGRRKK